MITWIYLGSNRQLPDGVVIASPSEVNAKVQQLSKITRSKYNAKGVLIERAKYPILRQTTAARNRANYHMASLDGYLCEDLYLVEKQHIANWVGDIEETKSSQLNTVIDLQIGDSVISGTLLEFHNQGVVEGTITNLLKQPKYKGVLKTQQANAGYEFDEMLAEIYCGQTSDTIWGWLNIVKTLDTENRSNAQQMVYVITELERKLLNRIDRKYFKYYFQEQSVSDAESTLRAASDDDSVNLFELTTESWAGTTDGDNFDQQVSAIKKLMTETEQNALDSYLSYVPDDKFFGETSTGLPICIKRCDVEAWDLPVDFIQLKVGDSVEFQMKDGGIHKVDIKRVQLDTTRQLFKIESSDSSGEAAKLRVFGLDKNYLQELATRIEDTTVELPNTKLQVANNVKFKAQPKPALTKYEIDILDKADSDTPAFLEAVLKAANKRYATKVTTAYEEESGKYVLESPTSRLTLTKAETFLRIALGK